ncbi:MAG: P-loop NTPase fold protein [Planctomycetota bacterium]
MEISSFKDDLFDLANFAGRLNTFIYVERNFVDGSLVIALSSKFGSGKSTFLRMWKSSLESDGGSPTVISLNAWESDYYGDPLFAIIDSLLSQVQSSGEAEEGINKIADAARDVGWLSVALGSQVAKKFTGIAPAAAGEYAEKKSKKRKPELIDEFSAFGARRDAMIKLKQSINDFIDASTQGGVLCSGLAVDLSDWKTVRGRLSAVPEKKLQILKNRALPGFCS